MTMTPADIHGQESAGTAVATAIYRIFYSSQKLAFAPPKSVQTIAVVPTSGVVRAQNCTTCEKPTIRSRLACMTGTQKALLVGVIAAAIIIPIALDDDDNAS
jgi:hypothetical protein